MAAMGAQAQPQAAQGGFWANYRSHTGPDTQPKAAEDDRLWAGQCGHSRGEGRAKSYTYRQAGSAGPAGAQARTDRRKASADAVRVRNRRRPAGRIRAEAAGESLRHAVLPPEPPIIFL